METKPRILYLQKILLERTDEENPLSTTQLINMLNDEYGISAHRTTVTKDIAALLRVNNQKTERCFFRAKKYIPAVNYCKTVYNS